MLGVVYLIACWLNNSQETVTPIFLLATEFMHFVGMPNMDVHFRQHILCFSTLFHCLTKRLKCSIFPAKRYLQKQQLARATR